MSQNKLKNSKMTSSKTNNNMNNSQYKPSKSQIGGDKNNLSKLGDNNKAYQSQMIIQL